MQVQTEWKPIKPLKSTKIQSYQWGRTDSECVVAKCSQNQLKSYAQLWMGVHPNGASKISENLTLESYLSQNDKPSLPFLFKVLSIKSCLSIQVHPNKSQAEKLNSERPDIYRDPNEKPEMALTLSETFEVLHDFVNEKQFENLLQLQPFEELAQKNTKTTNKERICSMIELITSLNQPQVYSSIEKLKANLSSFPPRRQKLFTKLFGQFSHDTGVLVSFLLEFKELPKYSCFAISAGTPHAYIEGQCLQLMNNSDNVLRLGLTPKLKDVPNLVQIIRAKINKTQQDSVSFQSNGSIQEFSWDSFKIFKLNSHDLGIFHLELKSQAIAICLRGNFKAKANEQVCLEEIKAFQSYYFAAGEYDFEGQGELFIATKGDPI